MSRGPKTEAELQADIAKALRRIRELDHLRDEYMRNVSHEFRTPLTVIRGYVEYLHDSDGSLDDESVRSICETVLESCDRVIELVDTLLEVSRVEGGPAERALELAELDLIGLVGSLAEDASSRARDGREVTLKLQQSPLMLQADRTLLSRAIRQLLDNAIKFSPPGGRVVLRAGEHGDGVFCEVEDFGPGIAPEDRERIFQKFVMLDGGLDRRGPGTGVGLYLAREAVRLHRGSLEVASEPGRGSVFKILLPRSPEGS